MLLSSELDLTSSGGMTRIQRFTETFWQVNLPTISVRIPMTRL